MLEKTGSSSCGIPICPNTEVPSSERRYRDLGSSDAADRRLIQRVRNADQAALAEIFDCYSRSVFSVAIRILKDEGDAEDIMQEIFFRLWQDPDKFVPGRGSLRGWLIASTRNRSIDVLRRRKPTENVLELPLASGCNQAKETEHNALVARAYKAMENLPLRQQETLRLAFCEELTHVEIAERTGEALGTVKTRVRTALIALKKALVTV